MNVKSAIMLGMILALLSSPVLACAKSEVAEEAKGDIVIGILDDLSAAMAGTASAFVDGQLDAIRYINEEQGGMLGHELRPVVIDFKLDAALAIAGWDRLKGEGAPLVMSLIGAGAPILSQSAQKDHIPMVTGAGSLDQLFPKEPSYYFAMGPQLTGVLDSMTNLIEEDQEKRGETRPPKLGFDLISIGTQAKVMSKAAAMKMETTGWDHIVTYTSIAPADVTTQVLQMKDFSCDYIYIHGTEAAAIVWLKELDRQGFYPNIYGTVTLGSKEVWSATHDLAIGSTFYQFGVQWTDTDIEGVKLIHHFNNKWHPDVTGRSGHYLRGFAGLLAIAEGLRIANEDAGYENLNGEVMKAALETVRNFDPLKMGMGYTWTPTDHQGLPGCRWYTWKEDGSVVAISDWHIFEPLPEEQRSDSWWMQRE
jgi:branched-chain amino acid transport system substrate-binding protein